MALPIFNYISVNCQSFEVDYRNSALLFGGSFVAILNDTENNLLTNEKSVGWGVTAQEPKFNSWYYVHDWCSLRYTPPHPYPHQHLQDDPGKPQHCQARAVPHSQT